MRLVALALAVLVVLSGGAPQAAAAGLVASDGHRTPLQMAPSGVSPSSTTFDVQLYGNQSARWNVTMTYALDGATERQAFQRYAREYAAGETEGAVSVRFFTEASLQTSSYTGRKMAIRNASREWAVRDNGSTGVLRLSFTWTNFLAQEGNETLTLHDAFMTGPSDTWLDSLNRRQTLIIRPPEGYQFTSGRYFHSEGLGLGGKLVVEGPEQFNPEEQISISWTKVGGTNPDESFPWLFAIGASVAALVVVGALVGGYTLTRRRGPPAPAALADRLTPTDGGQSAPEPGDVESTAETPDGPDGAGGAAAGAAGSAAAAAGASTEESDDDTADEEEIDLSLLSDEERVEHLLDRNGGRMKQANIVKETGWSDAKVSQLLSKMDEEGRVDKLRLGRENLISLPKGENETTDDDA